MPHASVLTDGGTGLPDERAQSLGHLDLRAGERVLQVVAANVPDLFVAVPALPGLDGRADVELHRATHAECAALPSHRFDAVVLHEVLDRVDDPCACLREAQRLARRGGRIAVYGRFLPDGFAPPRWIATGTGLRRGLRTTARSFNDILTLARIEARLTWQADGLRGSGFRAFELRTAPGAAATGRAVGSAWTTAARRRAT